MSLRNKCCNITKNFHDLCNIAEIEDSGIYFVENDKGKVLGIMTDGDIRRAKLRGTPDNTPLTALINRSFIYLREDNPKDKLNIDSRIKQIPILDNNGRLLGITGFHKKNIIPIAMPVLDNNEGKYVAECIATEWISSQGVFVTDFEKIFGKAHENSFAISTSSGTTALHLAIVGLGIGKGDEVIVPASTFAASANAVIHAGAKPVFVDVDKDTWCINTNEIKKAITTKTKAILPVHLYGHPADMHEIMTIAQEYNLKIIEDCAESLGATFKGRPTGVFGDAGCFSFFANKVITTGEGGMVICKNYQLMQRLKQLRDHGTSFSRRYWHEVVGYNYRMTNIQGAIGIAQMEQINRFLERRAKISNIYMSRLSKIPGIGLPHIPKEHDSKNIFWLFTIKIDAKKFGIDRDMLQLELQKRGIDSRPFFPALPPQPAFKKYRHHDYPISKNLGLQGLSLPSGNAILPKDCNIICDTIKKIYKDKN